MRVYVVIGYNGILKGTGVVGVGSTMEIAERIQAEKEYMLDDSMIQEVEVTES